MGSGAERETDEGTESTLAVPAGLLSSTAFLLAMVGAESRKRWVGGLARWALRPSHFAALMALDEIGPISQQDLARLVGVDPRNLVPVVDLLEQRSLVERQPHPTDRRRHAVRLTPGVSSCWLVCERAVRFSSGRCWPPSTSPSKTP